MADLATLRVSLIADLRKFAAGMKEAGSRVKQFAATVKSSMKSAGAAIVRFAANTARAMKDFVIRWTKRAAIAVIAFGIASIKMATDVEESENLVRKSFGDMTDAVVEWSERMQTELGLNASSLRDQAGLLNLLTMSMGLTAEQGFLVGTSIAELAVHVASLRNRKFEVVLEKMRSGLLGISRPLMDIGINIQEDAMELFLLNEGLDDNVQKLTAAQKVMVRYGLILEQTETDTGDLSDTADDTQNVIRIFIEQVKLLMEQLGKKLLPTVNALAISMRDWLMNNREDIVEWFGTAIDKFTAIITFLRTDYEQGFKGLGAMLIAVLKASVEAMAALWRIAWTKMGEDVLPMLLTGMKNAVVFARQKSLKIAKIMGGNLLEIVKFPFSGEADFVNPLRAYQESAQGSINLSKELEQVYVDLAAKLKAITVETIKWGEAHGKTAEEIKAEEEARIAREKELADMRAANIKKRAEDLAQIKKDLRESLAGISEAAGSAAGGVIEAIDALEPVTRSFATDWKDMWTDAAGSIMGAMRTAWADAILQAKSATEIISALVQKMARSIVESSFTAFVQPGIADIFSAIAGAGISPQRAPATREAQFFGRGGIAKPVYAAQGFVAKGADTVPAMLSPGEGVLRAEQLDRLVDAVSAPASGPVNINIQTMDEAGVAQWAHKNKRILAAAAIDANRTNNPIRRMSGNRRR